MKVRHLVLLLTDTSLSAYAVHRDHIDTLAQWPLDESMPPALLHLSGRHANATFHLLTDVSGEDFRQESLPHLKGADRHALLERKLQQTYPDTPYRQARSVTRQGTQEIFLLCALPAREWIKRIVDSLGQGKYAFSGIHSVTLAISDLLQQSWKIKQGLLLCPSSGNRLHQCYFTPAGLRFARHGYLPAHTEDHATAMAHETRQLCQYLSSQHILEHDTPLDIILLADPDRQSGIEPQYIRALQAQLPSSRQHILPIPDLAAKLGMPRHAGLQTLLMLAMADGRVGNHYAPPHVRKHLRLRRLGAAINTLSLLIFLTGGALIWHGGTRLVQQQAALEASQVTLNSIIQQQELQATREQNPTETLTVRDQEAIRLYRNFLNGWPDVDQDAQHISQHLAGLPLLTIEQFQWHAHSDQTLLEDKASHTANNVTLSHGERGQIINLDGRIDSGNYRTALTQLEQLQTRLQAIPHSRIIVQKPPIDLGPQGNLSSQDLATESAHFSLRILIEREQELQP